MTTITAGDYSIEIDIDEVFYDKWKKKVDEHDKEDLWYQTAIQKHNLHRHKNESWASFFTKWLSREIEHRLSNEPNLGFNCLDKNHMVVANT